MIDDLLTQEMQQEMMYNNDDVDNAESVLEECATSTPTSGDSSQLTINHTNDGDFIAEGEGQQLMNTQQILTPSTQEECEGSTTVASTPLLVR